MENVLNEEKEKTVEHNCSNSVTTEEDLIDCIQSIKMILISTSSKREKTKAEKQIWNLIFTVLD